MKVYLNKWKQYALSLVLLTYAFSCGQAEKEAESVIEVEPPAVEAAAEEYADIVSNSLDKFQGLDYVGMMENLTDDVEWYWPNGNAETRSTIQGKDSLMAFWQAYEEMSGLKEMQFTNRNMMPLKVNSPTNYYNVEGTVVLYYGDIHAIYENDTISVRQHIAYTFDDNMKINRMFLYYDRTEWMAMSGAVIE